MPFQQFFQIPLVGFCTLFDMDQIQQHSGLRVGQTVPLHIFIHPLFEQLRRRAQHGTHILPFTAMIAHRLPFLSPNSYRANI